MADCENRPSLLTEKLALSRPNGGVASSLVSMHESNLEPEAKRANPAPGGITFAEDVDAPQKSDDAVQKPRGVQFQISVASRADGDEETLETSENKQYGDEGGGELTKKKTGISRFLKGDAHGGSSKKSKARHTLGFPGRKSMAKRTTSKKNENNLKTRKTFGAPPSASVLDEDVVLDDVSNILLQSSGDRVGREEKKGGPSSSGDGTCLKRHGKGKVDNNRSRSASRGPRRGRDRFRGMGAIFSTSQVRNAPRSPRPTVKGDAAEGNSSKTLLSFLRSKRMTSPSPNRDSDHSDVMDAEHEGENVAAVMRGEEFHSKRQ